MAKITLVLEDDEDGFLADFTGDLPTETTGEPTQSQRMAMRIRALIHMSTLSQEIASKVSLAVMPPVGPTQ